MKSIKRKPKWEDSSMYQNDLEQFLSNLKVSQDNLDFAKRTYKLSKKNWTLL